MPDDTSASSSPLLAFPKQRRTRKQEKAKAGRHHQQARSAFRIKIVRDRGHQCLRCGVAVLEQTEDWWRLAHVHEVVGRAQGGSDLDEGNVVVLCPRCHQRVTDNELTVVRRRGAWAVIAASRSRSRNWRAARDGGDRSSSGRRRPRGR